MSSLVLLAGGMATRLRPVTETIPKSMLEVAGKPFIEHQLRLIKKNRIAKVIICASFLGEYIQRFTGDGSDYGLDIQYSFDGDKLLGTGGAIKRAIDLPDDNFFVMYGDSYLTTDFQKTGEYFLSKNKQGLMTVFKNEGKWDKSNIEYSNGEIIDYDKSSGDEKMKYIDYGLGILNKNAFKDFENRDEFDLEEVYKNLLKKNELLGYEVKERFYEIGSFEGLEETSQLLITN
ncbi:MAG: NTP transferase domain-containing protein [Ignavibacteria bacterium]|nr:NTP transferase domain-containing protein [Ignavibacteria bacterium]